MGLRVGARLVRGQKGGGGHRVILSLRCLSCDGEEVVQRLGGTGVQSIVGGLRHRLAGVVGEGARHRHTVVHHGGLDDPAVQELGRSPRITTLQSPGCGRGDVRRARLGEVEDGLPVVLPLGKVAGGVDPDMDVGVGPREGKPCSLVRPAAVGTDHHGDGRLSAQFGRKAGVASLEGRLGLGDEVLRGLLGLLGLGALLCVRSSLALLDLGKQAGLLDRLLGVLIQALPFGVARRLLDGDRLGDGVAGGVRGLGCLVGELGGLVRVLHRLARVLGRPFRGDGGPFRVASGAVGGVTCGARCPGRCVGEGLSCAGGVGGDGGVGAGDLGLALGLGGLVLGRTRGGSSGGGGAVRGRGCAARLGRGVPGDHGSVFGGLGLGGVLGRGDGRVVGLGGGGSGIGGRLARGRGRVGGSARGLDGGVGGVGGHAGRVGGALRGLPGLAGRLA